ncbi:MAG: hypothetical protein LC723_11415 [Actinobacteria bacterium]|nr:hypothetical protein [Actinomycetota bacterium]
MQMPITLRIRRAVMVLVVVMVSTGCAAPTNSKKKNTGDLPEVSVKSFYTGREAVQAALKQVHVETTIARISLLFARPKGTAEFWTIDLAEPSGAVTRVDLQARTVVRATVSTDPAPTQTVDESRFNVDTPDGASQAKAIPWAPPSASVLLSVTPWLIGDPSGPPAASGKPVWVYTIYAKPRGQAIGTVWVSTETGEVLFDCQVGVTC